MSAEEEFTDDDGYGVKLKSSRGLSKHLQRIQGNKQTKSADSTQEKEGSKHAAGKLAVDKKISKKSAAHAATGSKLEKAPIVSNSAAMASNSNQKKKKTPRKLENQNKSREESSSI